MGELICIRTYSNRLEAETVKSFLEANKIMTTLVTDDAGGMRPELTMSRGVKILVKIEDKEPALALIKKEDKKNYSAMAVREYKKMIRQAPIVLSIAILTLVIAAGLFWAGAGDDLKVLGVLCIFISAVCWGVWFTAMLRKKELEKKNL